MYIKRKKNRSGTTSVVVCSKVKGVYQEHKTIGISKDPEEIEALVRQGQQWIIEKEGHRQPSLDLFGEESKAREDEVEEAEVFLSRVSNVLLNGQDLILDRVFDRIGFDQIKDRVFRQLVKARLSYPASKAATSAYLKNHFDEDVNLSRIYRYLDRLHDRAHQLVQEISVSHTLELFGGRIGMLFYDVTTLYFETDREDELRKTGFSKEGRHTHPQIILGLLVTLEGYPLAYCIHEGNKYEGHTMLPMIKEFVQAHDLNDFVVVADSGLMNSANMEELEQLGYQYIIGARIKKESKAVQEWILSQVKRDGRMVCYDKGGSRRLVVGYTSDRAKKDAYNRDKGVRRLEKSYRQGKLTKAHINRRGYNRFLDIKGHTVISINEERIREDSKWDGLKGYLTNTSLSMEEIYGAYHNLWQIERSFRIAKSKIEIRPMFHFTHRRIQAHVCICFVALKVYKELERLLKKSDIRLSVDKVLAMAKTVTTIEIQLPKNKSILRKTLIMKRHKPIKSLFSDYFWGTQ